MTKPLERFSLIIQIFLWNKFQFLMKFLTKLWQGLGKGIYPRSNYQQVFLKENLVEWDHVDEIHCQPFFSRIVFM